MGYLQNNLNTIIGIIIVIIILSLYYGYYFIENMIHTQIKNFYIKTEKRRLLKEKIEKDKTKEKEKENVLYQQRQNIELQNNLQEKNTEVDFINFGDMGIDNDNDNDNLDMDSFMDPMQNIDACQNINQNIDQIKNKKSSNNIDEANQNLANRIFNS